ncbi:MAG: ATP-binding protein [Bradymonadales bacterium]|nr:MAG: ATP-binding protein [Bradymonadales bacterium]
MTDWMRYVETELAGLDSDFSKELKPSLGALKDFDFDDEMLTRFERIREVFSLSKGEMRLVILAFVDRALSHQVLGPIRSLDDLCLYSTEHTIQLDSRDSLKRLFSENIQLRDSLFYFLANRDCCPVSLKKTPAKSVFGMSKFPVDKILRLAAGGAKVEILTEDPLLMGARLGGENVFELTEPTGAVEEVKLFKDLFGAIVWCSRIDKPEAPIFSMVDICITSVDSRRQPSAQEYRFKFTDTEFEKIDAINLWQAETEAAKLRCSTEDLKRVSTVFSYGLTQIRPIVQEMKAEQREAWSFEEMARLCRKRNSIELEAYARRIESRYDWEDLVLPPPCLLQLKEAERFILTRRSRKELSRRHSRGQGVSLVFEGPSGTGKTMAAEVLAKSLGLDLYQVNLSKLTSQFIGETEKNLSAVFRAAQDAAGILFFDEGESLFSKRSQGATVQDKYSNLEVNHLLQELESFEGIVVISTNLGENIDSAFLRRINFELRFPRPNGGARQKIWELHLKKDCGDLSDIDYHALSELPLTGGFIRNVVDRASAAALYESRPVSMKDLMHAIKREYQKVKWPIQREQFDSKYWKLVSPDWDENQARRRLKDWAA